MSDEAFCFARALISVTNQLFVAADYTHNFLTISTAQHF
jgi:hypothetical protein